MNNPNIYLLEGKHSHYVCIANDLLEIERQLRDRYSWTKNLEIQLISVGGEGFDHHLYFDINWEQYSFNEYKYVGKEAKFEVLLCKQLPIENKLIPQNKDNYF